MTTPVNSSGKLTEPLTVATAADESALKEYFSSIVLPGPIPMKLFRAGSFFDQYRLQSEEFEVLKLTDANGKIEGLAAIIFRNAFIAGKLVKIGYCTDLRLSPSREAVIGWNQFFPGALADASKRHQAKWIFSVVPQTDGKGNNALIRPRTSRRGTFQSILVSAFESVAILGRSPFAPEPLKTIQIRESKIADIEKLAKYLTAKSINRPLGYDYSAAFIEKRLQSWPSLRIEDILIAENRAGQIIGCTALWNGSRVQELIPDHYAGFSGTLKTALHVGSWFGLSHRLPNPGKAMDIVWATMLNADNPDIFYSLLHRAYEKTLPGKFLVYTHFPKTPLTLPPRTFFAASLPYGLYAVVPQNEILPDELRESRIKISPEIEIPLI